MPRRRSKKKPELTSNAEKAESEMAKAAEKLNKKEAASWRSEIGCAGDVARAELFRKNASLFLRWKKNPRGLDGRVASGHKGVGRTEALCRNRLRQKSAIR